MRQRVGGKAGIDSRFVDPEDFAVRKPHKGSQKFDLKKFASSFFDEIDCTSLIFFRILWGFIMAMEAYGFARSNYAKLRLITGPTLNLNYQGFEWISPWDYPLVEKLQVMIVFVAALGIMIGFCYRTCAVVFFFIFTHLWMQEASNYLNHIYLVSVMSFFAIFLPMNRWFSVDSLIWPEIRRKTVPRWTVMALRYYIAVVYVYASIAKMNQDWMLRAEPLRHWLPGHAKNLFGVGFLLRETWVAYFMSWSGFLIDATAPPLLLYKPLVALGTLSTYSFHCLNKIIFNIGIFPWVMMASQTIFFEPDWLIKIVHYLGYFTWYKAAKTVKKRDKLTVVERLVLLFIILFFVHQILTPLRHHLIPGNVAWTEEGHLFSWRMKLRDKECTSAFMINSTLSPRLREYPIQSVLTTRQYSKMNGRPYLVWWVAKTIADDIEKEKGVRPSVYVKDVCVLNFRFPAQYLIDPNADLASYPKYLTPAPFITRQGVKKWIPKEGEDEITDRLVAYIHEHSKRVLNRGREKLWFHDRHKKRVKGVVKQFDSVTG